MVSIVSLWLPILLAAVLVFVVSSLIHTVLNWHHNDFAKLPAEDQVAAALRPMNIPPGEYMMPKPDTPKQMRDPAFVEKLNQGPVAMLTVWPNGQPNMRASLVQWFIYSLVVGVFAAYVATRAGLSHEAEYLSVFRMTGTVAFCCYSVALWQASIWWRRSWMTTFKYTVDGLIYALLTAGAFGWLWPS